MHPDLTVALANPIKFFSAHDKKSVKLKEAMGGLPEVCVACSMARCPWEFCLLSGRLRESAEPLAQGEGGRGHLPDLFSLHRSPSLLGVQLWGKSRGHWPQPATGQQVCTAESSHLLEKP